MTNKQRDSWTDDERARLWFAFRTGDDDSPEAQKAYLHFEQFKIMERAQEHFRDEGRGVLVGPIWLEPRDTPFGRWMKEAGILDDPDTKTYVTGWKYASEASGLGELRAQVGCAYEAAHLQTDTELFVKHHGEKEANRLAEVGRSIRELISQVDSYDPATECCFMLMNRRLQILQCGVLNGVGQHITSAALWRAGR